MPQTITAMIQKHPTEIRYDRQLLEECIAACVECAQACTSCAEACRSCGDECSSHADMHRHCEV